MRFLAILVFGALSAPILALPTSTGPHKGCFDDSVTPSCRLIKSRAVVPSSVEIDGTRLLRERDLETRKCNPTKEHCRQHDTRDGEERMKGEVVKAREPEVRVVVKKALPCKPLPQGGCGPPGLG